MKITLRNGKTIKLDWNPIILEYLEDYEGGIEQLKKDLNSKNHRFRTFNFIIYCMIAAIYPEELSYRKAVSLVDINDIDTIVMFVVSNVSKLKEIKSNKVKKVVRKVPQTKHIR